VSSHWETGVVVNTPTWHRLEKAVLPEHITDWETGRKEAGIDWEVYPDHVFTHEPDGHLRVADWQAIRRDDTHAVLSIQPTSYAIVNIAQFGEVIEAVAGKGLKYEAIFSLYEGRKIVALLYFDDPLDIRADNGVTRTVQYLAMTTNFDGNGGIRGIPTSVRVICANTLNMAEASDGKAVGFSIRHTSNWTERVAQAGEVIQGARRDAAAWSAIANALADKPVNATGRETYLKRFLPSSSDMTERQERTVEAGRDAIRGLLTSATNAHIAENYYGLVMASTEWADHVRDFRTEDSYVARQLRKEPMKARAVRVACRSAGVDRKSILVELEDARR